MILSNNQNEGLDRLKSFIQSNELLFTLSGYAGTGKTTLLKTFLSTYSRSVIITAPTHKAVRVAEAMVGRVGKTLHSLLGLRPDVSLESFDINNMKFNSLVEPSIKNYSLIIIDECSQINKDLFSLIVKESMKYKSKIIFVGDEAQLPPIKEHISYCFQITNKYVLTEIVRQEESNPLLEILTMLREDIRNNTSKTIPYMLSNKSNLINDKGWIVLQKEDFQNETLKLFISNEFTNINHAKFITRTNSSVISWNKYIRDNKFGEKSHKLLIPNDLLMGYKTIVDEYLQPIIINSEDYIVKSVVERVDDYGFNCYLAVIENIYDKSLKRIVIADTNDSNKLLYFSELNSLYRKAINSTPLERGRKWKEYYKFKERYLSMINISLEGSTSIRDIDYGYAITSHKAQGSTYENVVVNALNLCFYNFNGSFIEMKDNQYNPKGNVLKNQLLYVALSRATNKAILLL